jgi:hypothetical protein
MLLHQEYLFTATWWNVAVESRSRMNNVGVTMRAIATAAAGTRTEAKLQALSWLASQLEWERTLGALRHGEAVDDDCRAA